jgi:hypothetical protein
MYWRNEIENSALVMQTAVSSRLRLPVRDRSQINCKTLCRQFAIEKLMTRINLFVCKFFRADGVSTALVLVSCFAGVSQILLVITCCYCCHKLHYVSGNPSGCDDRLTVTFAMTSHWQSLRAATICIQV